MDNPQREKPIRLSGHARQQLARRGATEAEIVQTIRSAVWQPAELGKQECRMDFPYNALWNGKRYSVKQVRPIFVEEEEEIVVITVYIFRGDTIMKISYDSEVDVLYIQFLETTVSTQALAEGIAADYDQEGRLAGIEILDALKRFGDPNIL